MVTSAMFVLAVGCSATLSELPGDVWRFDNVEELPKHMAVNAPRYAQHRGDKCVYLSEIIDGRRLDYVCYDNDEVR